MIGALVPLAPAALAVAAAGAVVKRARTVRTSDSHAADLAELQTVMADPGSVDHALSAGTRHLAGMLDADRADIVLYIPANKPIATMSLRDGELGPFPERPSQDFRQLCTDWGHSDRRVRSLAAGDIHPLAPWVRARRHNEHILMAPLLAPESHGVVVLSRSSAPFRQADVKLLTAALPSLVDGLREARSATLRAAQRQALPGGALDLDLDPITGLPDEAVLNDFLVDLDGSQQHGVAVLAMALDSVSGPVFDVEVGSAPIRREVAGRVLSAVRGSDLCLSASDGVLLVVMRGLTDMKVPTLAAARILDRVGRPMWVDGRVIALRGRVGIATSPPASSGPALRAGAQRALEMALASSTHRVHTDQDEPDAVRMRVRSQLDLSVESSNHG